MARNTSDTEDDKLKTKLLTIALFAVLLLVACDGDTPEPTAEPTVPQPTSIPPTPEPPVGPHPLDSAECSELADVVAQAVGLPTTIGEAPFEDFITRETGTGCQVLATGTDVDLPDVNVAVDALMSALQAQGWEEDMMYGGGGGGGWLAGYRRDDALCIFVFSSEPSDMSLCGDEPLPSCFGRLDPEDRIRSFDFICAQGVQPALHRDPPTEAPPSPMPEPTSVPPTPTLEPVSSIQPIDAIECQELADLMTRAVGIAATMGEAPFEDFRTGEAGTGCQVLATGSDANIDDVNKVTNGLMDALEVAGWQEDVRYALGGAGGWGTGYRRGDRLCLAVFASEPSDPVLCGDEPFAVCWDRLEPEQRLRTFELVCVRDPAAGSPPTSVTLGDGLQCLYEGWDDALVFDGLRLNYTCDLSAGGQIVGLLGDLFPVDGDTWLAQKAFVDLGGAGLVSTELVTVYAEP